MTEPVDRIRALKLTDEDLSDVYERWCIGYHFEGDPLGMLEYSMEKQYTKLLIGLVDWLKDEAFIDDEDEWLDMYQRGMLRMINTLREALTPSGDDSEQLKNVKNSSAATDS